MQGVRRFASSLNHNGLPILQVEQIVTLVLAASHLTYVMEAGRTPC
jgi:ABC-type branched-subunit amino acid transport system ATPase component